MGEILPFKKPRGKKLGLCQHGFHQWLVVGNTRFDVKKGKLVTAYKCSRCGLEKVTAQ
jgi:hypothetical protein